MEIILSLVVGGILGVFIISGMATLYIMLSE